MDLTLIETPLGSFDCYAGAYFENEPEKNYVGHVAKIYGSWQYMVNAPRPRYARPKFNTPEQAAQALAEAL